MKDLNWDNLLTTTPQFVPNPDNDTDTTYFQGVLYRNNNNNNDNDNIAVLYAYMQSKT